MVKTMVLERKENGMVFIEIHPYGHRIFNLTPHPVIVNRIKLPPSGQVARVEEKTRFEADFAPFVLRHVRTGKVVGLPPKREGVWYIVSRPVALILAGIRDDLLVPDDFVRDGEGRIVGAKVLTVLEKESLPEDCPYREGEYGAVCNYWGQAAFSCSERNCPLRRE